jgi:hypothetical protein
MHQSSQQHIANKQSIVQLGKRAKPENERITPDQAFETYHSNKRKVGA